MAMKRSRFITLIGVLIFGFAACTEDENNAAYNVPESINKKTRATYTITYDDIQAKVDELHIIYAIGSTTINREQPISIFNDRFFLNLENMIRKEVGLEPLEKSSISLNND